MLALDGFEEGLEVAFSEGLGAFALNDFNEYRRAVHQGLGEELQQVALVVAVDQDSELAQRSEVFVDFAHAVEHLVVVGIGNGQEVNTACTEFGDRFDDVVGSQGKVLHARPSVEVDVLLDLGLFAALGGFVDRELDAAVAIAHHLRH